MDGGSSHRAEAERWLTAAEKLLATRDFHGTKSFAIRARECDPRMEAADRLLAVVDTLLAGECLINNQPDWYAILQLSHLTQGVEVIADHYRRLVLLLNPERNRFPFADQAFRLVSEAWTVLSNPSKKAFYDNELRMIQLGHVGFQPPKKSPRNKEPSVAPVEQERPIFENGAGTTRQQAQPARPATASAATTQQPNDSSGSANFWTACPYCYVLYEYARVYEDCALKCQNCERSFQAVPVTPPPVTEKDTFYNCWGYFPLAYSGKDKGPSEGSGWKPISPMFTCPVQPNGKAKKGRKGANAAPRVYYDDEDVYVEVSDPSDDSDDDDWDGGSSSNKKKKRGRPPKVKSPTSKTVNKKIPTERRAAHQPDQPVTGAAESLVGGTAGQTSERVESSRKGAGNPVRKQAGRGAKALGKLDLNVEFNNEVEEPARAVSGGTGGHGEEDNIEGTGFFEGLDEFLSSLPILSVVGDDKVKAA